MPSPWLTGLRAVALPLAGALPAALVALFAGLLALACESGRRAYALAYADRLIDLAAVLVGHPRTDT